MDIWKWHLRSQDMPRGIRGMNEVGGEPRTIDPRVWIVGHCVISFVDGGGRGGVCG